MQHLSPEGAGWTGHYAGIPAPFGGEGDSRSASVSVIPEFVCYDVY